MQIYYPCPWYDILRLTGVNCVNSCWGNERLIASPVLEWTTKNTIVERFCGSLPCMICLLRWQLLATPFTNKNYSIPSSIIWLIDPYFRLSSIIVLVFLFICCSYKHLIHQSAHIRHSVHKIKSSIIAVVMIVLEWVQMLCWFVWVCWHYLKLKLTCL